MGRPGFARPPLPFLTALAPDHLHALFLRAPRRIVDLDDGRVAILTGRLLDHSNVAASCKPSDADANGFSRQGRREDRSAFIVPSA